MRRRSRLAGFTLLELLVVLVLAGISAAVVGGGAQSFMDRARYHQTVRDVASRLSQARALFVSGERFTAERAFEIGLVHAVTGADDLDATVSSLAGRMLSTTVSAPPGAGA